MGPTLTQNKVYKTLFPPQVRLVRHMCIVSRHHLHIRLSPECRDAAPSAPPTTAPEQVLHIHVLGFFRVLTQLIPLQPEPEHHRMTRNSSGIQNICDELQSEPHRTSQDSNNILRTCCVCCVRSFTLSLKYIFCQLSALKCVKTTFVLHVVGSRLKVLLQEHEFNGKQTLHCKHYFVLR